jgi:low affinity Fe/Cu permease
VGDWSIFGRILVFIGVGLVILGALIWGVSRVFPIGRLPGDFLFQREGFTIYIPIATSILLSLILTLLLNLIRR